MKLDAESMFIELSDAKDHITNVCKCTDRLDVEACEKAERLVRGIEDLMKYFYHKAEMWRHV